MKFFKKYKILTGIILLIVLVLTMAFIYDGRTPSDGVLSSAEMSLEKKTEPVAELDKNTETGKVVIEEKTAVPKKVPEEKAEIAEIEEVKEQTCTLSVRCDTILNNLNLLDGEKTELVPKDGVIYPERTVAFFDGESVFDVLVREMRQNNIHLEFVEVPIYNSAYIEGIANIYEFDCGELSGWQYAVNGSFPGFGCSGYRLKNGDRIEWRYTCNLGKDIGGENSARNGMQ